MAIQPRTPRLFVDSPLAGDDLSLTEGDTHYLGRVLRLKRGDDVIVFNGRGEERAAQVSALTRREARLRMLQAIDPLPEPDLDLILLQALLKAEAMDFVIQKATELGVRTICPVETRFSVVKLEGDRAARRLEHWLRKTRSACEQSGRHTPARIESPCSLGEALARLPADHLRLLLQPGAATTLDRIPAHATGICLLAGPEGGFSSEDLKIIEAAGFEQLSLGPRTLRAETAALAACVLAQARWGDMH